MDSEGNKDVLPNKELSVEKSSTSGAKRKRGRPRKYEYPTSELPHRALPIQSAPPFAVTQDGLNIQHDGVQGSHISGGNVGPKVCTVQVLSSQQNQGNRPGRPRNSANLVKTSDSQASCYSNAPLQGSAGKDGILGKHFVGKMTKKFPGFSLITVKVKDNQVLRGWVPDENNFRPITSKDDLAPELPMLRPSQIRKRASAIHQQAAPVTIAKPLQMRRPVENNIAKFTAPLSPRPYVGSGVVAAVPVSISHGNVETRTLSRKDTEIVISQQVANQNVLVGEKSVNEFQKDFESSDESKESSAKDKRPSTPLVDVVVRNSPGDSQLLHVQLADVVRSSGKSALVDATIMDEIKKASGTTQKSEQLKTETSVLTGVDGPSTGPSDDIHAVHDEHGVMVHSK